MTCDLGNHSVTRSKKSQLSVREFIAASIDYVKLLVVVRHLTTADGSRCSSSLLTDIDQPHLQTQFLLHTLLR